MTASEITFKLYFISGVVILILILGHTKKEMATVDKTERELQEFKERYGERLKVLENRLWSDEGTETQRAEWKGEKNELAEEKKRLEEMKDYWGKQVGMLQDRLTHR